MKLYAYLMSNGLTTARRKLYAWLSKMKLIMYVYDQFVTVSPL